MVREFVKHGSNSIIVGGLALGAAAIAARKLPFQPASIASGAALFFLSEYGSHRYLFHAEPSSNSAIRDLQHRMHYDHHVEPNRLDLLFLPPWYLVPNLAIAGAAYLAVTRSGQRTTSIVLGNLIGLLYYEWVHYVAHISFKPRTPFGRYIKKYHLWHHFKNEKMWFGVTNPAMDHLVGTYADVAEVEKSGTTRHLFADTTASFGTEPIVVDLRC